MKILPNKEQIHYTVSVFSTLGFGILTAERFLKVANLAYELFACQNTYGCQRPFSEYAIAAGTLAASAYTTLDLGLNLYQSKRDYITHAREVRRYTPRTLRPVKQDISSEIVAFHPGEEPQQKRYIYDTLDKIDDKET